MKTMTTATKPVLTTLMLGAALLATSLATSHANPAAQPVTYLAIPLSSSVITATDPHAAAPLPQDAALLFSVEPQTLPALLSDEDLPPCYQQQAEASEMPPVRVISSR